MIVWLVAGLMELPYHLTHSRLKVFSNRSEKVVEVRRSFHRTESSRMLREAGFCFRAFSVQF